MLKNPPSNTGINAPVLDARTSFPPPQFPLRLHDMLDNAEIEGYQHIVCWLPEGNGFHIHDPDAMLPILQKCGFNQSKWKSFLRQLQNYGFRREIRGPTKGVCKHPDLIRGRRELCMNMRRIKKWSSADNLSKTHQSGKKTNKVNKALDLIEGRSSRATNSAPTLSLRRNLNASSTPLSIESWYPPCQSTKNATFDFVPTNSFATASKSQGSRNLFMNRTQHLIWDIQKEISMVNMQQSCDYDSSSDESDFDPFNYRCPSPLSKQVESMDAYETDNLMRTIFLHEPSLEETYH